MQYILISRLEGYFNTLTIDGIRPVVGILILTN